MDSAAAAAQDRRHLCFDGSPEAVGLDTVRAALNTGRAVFKARRLDWLDLTGKGETLQEGEKFLTSRARLNNYSARIDLKVIIVEGLLIFEKNLNAILESIDADLNEADQDGLRLLLEVAAAGSVKLLVKAYKLQDRLQQKKISGVEVSVEDKNLLSRVVQAAKKTSHKDKLTMSGLASGIVQAGLPDPELETSIPRRVQMYKEARLAAQTVGINTFKTVLQTAMDLAEGEPAKEAMKGLCQNTRAAIINFGCFFEARSMRNDLCHPFSPSQPGLGGHKDAAEALRIFKENGAEFPDIQMLIKAGVPFLETHVTQIQQRREELKVKSNMNAALDSLKIF